LSIKYFLLLFLFISASFGFEIDTPPQLITPKYVILKDKKPISVHKKYITIISFPNATIERHFSRIKFKVFYINRQKNQIILQPKGIIDGGIVYLSLSSLGKQMNYILKIETVNGKDCQYRGERNGVICKKLIRNKYNDKIEDIDIPYSPIYIVETKHRFH